MVIALQTKNQSYFSPETAVTGRDVTTDALQFTSSSAWECHMTPLSTSLVLLVVWRILCSLIDGDDGGDSDGGPERTWSRGQAAHSGRDSKLHLAAEAQ